MWRPAKHGWSFAVLWGSLVLGLPALWGQVRVGDPFPALPPVEPGGGASPVTAGHVAVVDFWASWCEPCKASFAAYDRLEHDYRAQGLVIVAVSVDEDPALYESFVKRHAPTFLTTRDKDQTLVSRVRIPTMPSSYLIDRAGKVRFLHSGFHGAETEAQLRKEIETLLAEKAS